MTTSPLYRLVAFDGDETLWTLTSGLNLSDRTPTDAVGWPDFKYERIKESKDARLVRRDDGALFTLRPEVPALLETLKQRGVVTGVISYNHAGNVRRILEAFGISEFVDYVIAEWHSKKDEMMRRMLDMARHDGHQLNPADAILLDDDPYSIYVHQYKRLGSGFRRVGYDIHDLSEVLSLAHDPSL